MFRFFLWLIGAIAAIAGLSIIVFTPTFETGTKLAIGGIIIMILTLDGFDE